MVLPILGTLMLILAGLCIVLEDLASMLWRVARAVGTVVWRWLTGAVMFKPYGVTDREFWDSAEDSPTVTRGVRAAARVAAVVWVAGFAFYPVPALLTVGTATALTGGFVGYRRVTAGRAVEGPVRVKAQIGR